MSKGRKHYKAMLSGPFKIAEKIKQERKGNGNRKRSKRA